MADGVSPLPRADAGLTRPSEPSAPSQGRSLWGDCRAHTSSDPCTIFRGPSSEKSEQDVGVRLFSSETRCSHLISRCA